MKQRDWIKLPIEKRLELIQQFDLKRSSFTDVRGGEIISDGFTDKDLELVDISLLDNQNLENGEENKQDEGTIGTGDIVKAESVKPKRGSKK